MSKLKLKQIKNYLEGTFPFECLQGEITEEFMNAFSREVKTILDQSGCHTVEEEWYFLTNLIEPEYWKSIAGK